jgi:hypothetical protein
LEVAQLEAAAALPRRWFIRRHRRMAMTASKNQTLQLSPKAANWQLGCTPA